MKKILILVLLLSATCLGWAAKPGYKKLYLQQRFMQGIWRNIKHINSDKSRFGSSRERVTAGVRGSDKTFQISETPTKTELQNKITLLKKMLYRTDLKREERIQAMFYISACYLFLEDRNNAELYCNRLERYAPKNPLVAQLRSDIALQRGQK